MRNRRSRITGIAWLAVAAWMVVIFLFSAQNDTQSGDTSGMVVRWFLSLLYRGFEDFSPERQQALLKPMKAEPRGGRWRRSDIFLSFFRG